MQNFKLKLWSDLQNNSLLIKFPPKEPVICVFQGTILFKETVNVTQLKERDAARFSQTID